MDLLSILKRKVYKHWQTEFDQTPMYKIKSVVGQWETSMNTNRRHEIVLARMRLNCVKGIHLLPRMEGTFPLECLCDGSRLTLAHIMFDCGFYINQRSRILERLRRDNKHVELRTILEDNNEYCSLVLQFLDDIDYMSKI